jgi:transcriptional regulator with XRE-family HTH domain
MKSKKPLIFPKHREVLDILGENITLARLRRKLTMVQVAERADIARSTLHLIEKGSENVAIGSYFNVLRSLNLHLDFLKLAGDDELGRKLQDLDLLNKEIPQIGVYDNIGFLKSTNDKREKKIQQTYLMINGVGNVKIGKSYNPTVRESTLQSEQPCIKLFAVGYSDIESTLHTKYSDKKIRGEWFDLSSLDVLDIIDEYGFIEVKSH